MCLYFTTAFVTEQAHSVLTDKLGSSRFSRVAISAALSSSSRNENTALVSQRQVGAGTDKLGSGQPGLPFSLGIPACCGGLRGSISFLRQKARAQKARKMGLSGLLASFPYINFALLIGQIYVLFRVLNDGFHLGKNPDLCTLLHEGEWGKRTPFCRRMAVKPGSAHTHNMQESQD